MVFEISKNVHGNNHSVKHFVFLEISKYQWLDLSKYDPTEFQITCLHLLFHETNVWLELQVSSIFESFQE